MRALSDSPATMSRQWYNKWVDENAKGEVLDVGKSTHWDYGYPTIDINPKLGPTILGDICNSGLLDGAYDTVLCNGMYEFVEDPQVMVDEVRRVLKPGGVAIFGFVGKDYKPYKKDWKYYDGGINFGMKVIKKKNFNDYHFIICRKI